MGVSTKMHSDCQPFSWVPSVVLVNLGTTEDVAEDISEYCADVVQEAFS